jgi:shikimate kinase
MNVALFGFMGVGKTTVGRLLAESLGYSFVDTDTEIERMSGMAVSDVFSSKGEPVFREMEKVAIRRISAFDQQVISCGGGIVIDPENTSQLKRSSRMVLLTASPSEILKRVNGDSRPLLEAPDRERRVRDLLETRREAYLSAAELVLDTDGHTPREVAETITKWLEVNSH